MLGLVGRGALPLLEEALRDGATPSRFERAWLELETAKARGAVDPRDRSALQLAREAAAMFAEQPDLEVLRRDADAWIEAHLAARQPARSAARSSAARKLSGRATPLPAMSNAVP